MKEGLMPESSEGKAVNPASSFLPVSLSIAYLTIVAMDRKYLNLVNYAKKKCRRVTLNLHRHLALILECLSTAQVIL